MFSSSKVYHLERDLEIRVATCFIRFAVEHVIFRHSACPHENTYFFHALYLCFFVLCIFPALLAAAVDAPLAFYTGVTATRRAGDIIFAICRVSS